jgi:hypothetical protein
MWMLFTILLTAEGYYTHTQGPFLTMIECFEARDLLIETGPKPKINYEAVCIEMDTIGGGT